MGDGRPTPARFNASTKEQGKRAIMAEKSKKPPMATKDECPDCQGKDFDLLGRFEEGHGQWVEHRQCAKPKCRKVYRRPMNAPSN